MLSKGTRGPFDDERSNQPARGWSTVPDGARPVLVCDRDAPQWDLGATGLITTLGLRGPAEKDVFKGGRFNARGNQESVTLTGFNEESCCPWVVSGRPRPFSSRTGRRRRPWSTGGPGVSPPQPGLRFAALRLEGSPELPFPSVLAGDRLAGRRRVRLPKPARGGRIHPGSKSFSSDPWSGPVGTVRAVGGGKSGRYPDPGYGFDRIMGDTEAWCRELIEFLATAGLEVDGGSLDRALHSLDSTLRHQQPSPLPDDPIHASQREVMSTLEGLQGSPPPLAVPDLGDEPDWVEDVLAMRRQLVVLREQHRPSTSPLARAFRASGGPPAASRADRIRPMINVVTVHWKSDKWIDPQLAYLDRNIDEPYRVYAALRGIDRRHWGRFHFAADLDGDHPQKLNALAKIGMAESDPDDLLVFIDGDALPVRPIAAWMTDALSSYPLVAVRRDENLGDQQPHPCFAFTTCGFWEKSVGVGRRGAPGPMPRDRRSPMWVGTFCTS